MTPFALIPLRKTMMGEKTKIEFYKIKTMCYYNIINKIIERIRFQDGRSIIATSMYIFT